jgi:hypothetical protein
MIVARAQEQLLLPAMVLSGQTVAFALPKREGNILRVLWLDIL